jgi:hypothetical protein
MGVAKSVQEIIRAVEEGRLDPKTRAWTIETLERAGRPTNQIEQAKAILARLREERMFVPDPVDSEMVVSSACTLEGCHGLKFLGGDCDDLLVAFLAACESVGIECAVCNHAYDPKGNIPDHVLAAIYNRPDPRKRGQWIRCDPSTSLPFGDVHRPTRERIYLIPGGKLLCDTRGGLCPDARINSMGGVLENLRGNHGDFVGVGRPPTGMVGETAEPVFGDVSDAFYRFMLDQLQDAHADLEVALERMDQERREMELVVTTLGEPLVQDAKEGETNWTPKMEREYQSMRYMVPLYLDYLAQAVAGQRQVVWDEEQNTILITGVPGEPAIVTMPDGSLEVVETDDIEIPTPTGQVGLGQVAIGLIILAGLGLLVVGSYFQYRFMAHVADTFADYCRTVRFNRALEYEKNLRDSGVSPEEARRAREELLAKEHDRYKGEKEKKEEPFSDIMDTVKMGATAFLIVGAIGVGAYGLGQLVQLTRGGGRGR